MFWFPQSLLSAEASFELDFPLALAVLLLVVGSVTCMGSRYSLTERGRLDLEEWNPLALGSFGHFLNHCGLVAHPLEILLTAEARIGDQVSRS